MKINKDTAVCISVAKTAGNFGTTIYNHVFQKENLNFIYKSFSTENVEDALKGARALGFRGVSVTMPYKQSVLSFVDEKSEEVQALGAANTIVNTQGYLKAYNTDVDSTYQVLKRYDSFDTVHILGNGGFSKAAQFSAKKIFKNIKVYTRENWKDLEEIKEGVVFNCTPVKNLSFSEEVNFIDCDTNTESGKELAVLQAARQFKLYTNFEFPTLYILNNLDTIMNGK